jgi:hypothetical protein
MINFADRILKNTRYRLYTLSKPLFLGHTVRVRSWIFTAQWHETNIGIFDAEHTMLVARFSIATDIRRIFNNGSKNIPLNNTRYFTENVRCHIIFLLYFEFISTHKGSGSRFLEPLVISTKFYIVM